MQPDQKISRKILSLLLPSILLIFLITVTFINLKEYNSLNRALIQKGGDIADLYAITLEKPIWYIDIKQINQILDALLKDNEIVSIVLTVYTEGSSIKYSRNEELISDDLISFRRPIVHQTTSQEIGSITFYLTREVVFQKIKNTFISFAVIMIILLVTVIAVSNLIQRKVIYKPIMNLLDGINRNTKEKTYEPVAVTSRDEIGVLTESFNNMMENLKEYSRSLEAMVNERGLLLDELRNKNIILENEITGHKLSRNQIAIFRSFAEASGQGFGMSDLEGIMTYANPALGRLVGEENTENIIGKRFDLYSSDRMADRVKNLILPALKKDGQWTGELDVLSRQKKTIPTLLNVFVIRDEAGKAHYIAYVVSDISAHKQAEEEIRKLNEDLERRVDERTRELETANRELESFSYSVSHDLRAPLRAIDGFSRIIEESYGSSLEDKPRRYLKLVRDNTRMMAKLIDDILTFSRMQRQSINKETVFPKDIVEDTLNELKDMRGERRIEIKIDDLPPCNADPSLLRVVCNNLLSNAIKYTGKEELAVIEIGSKPSDEGVVYFVRDNGVGFDMKYAEKVFAVFQRLHSAQEFEGTGVGMSIVQRIIDRHGGRIWVESEAGRGTTFYFTLSPPR